MAVYELKTMQKCSICENTAVALGTFDGCHAGHINVINSAISAALRLHIKSAVYTFDTIPKATVDKKSVPCIFTLNEKLAFFRKLGVDYAYVDTFDNIREMSGEEFFETVLKKSLHAVFASCGFNYRFGKNASCNASDLRLMFEKSCESVAISNEITVGKDSLCSTLIRNMIENGETEKILTFSPPYSIYAKVEEGKHLGRTIGIPTINQHIPCGKVIPKKGVYITECEIGEDTYPSVTNIGTRPTTDGDGAAENAETHIIGYEENLYSSFVRVNFYKYLREEKKFRSVEDLKKEIEKNEQEALSYFGIGNK